MRLEGVKHHWSIMAVFSLIGLGLLWPSVSLACTVTTKAPAKPANFSAAVNDEGILLQWDAAAEADKVFRYEILRGVGAGSTPTGYGGMDLVAVYDTATGTYTYPTSSPMKTVDYSEMLVVNETYVYAVAFGRWDNCGGYQRGVQSNTVSVTYEPDN